MSYNTIILTKEEGVATLTLNRPDTLNAWNEEMGTESLQAMKKKVSFGDSPTAHFLFRLIAPMMESPLRRRFFDPVRPQCGLMYQ